MVDPVYELILHKYEQLNQLLMDFARACDMVDSFERDILVDSIKTRTNHHGIHLTKSELYELFLGKEPLNEHN